ncbi:hypothetical protein ILYODFUR_017519 [Ilyodon furcidens]|uniref:Uncharacterized protein n=1 Tax=Ilyodon furcidens TaxID=33524 RepID=A0ABV0TBR9_9TELE
MHKYQMRNIRITNDSREKSKAILNQLEPNSVPHSPVLQGSSWNSWKDSVKHKSLILGKRKKGSKVPLKQKALLHISNVRYEEDTILVTETGKTPSSKGRSFMFSVCTVCMCALLCT